MRLHHNVTGINSRKLPAFPAPPVYPTHSLQKDCRREKFTVLMYSPGDVVINDVHAHFLQLFAEVPGDDPAYSQYLAFVCLRRLGMRK